jgi:hypothetical protein
MVESMNRTAVLQRVEDFLLAASLDSIQRNQADEALGSFTNAIRLRIMPTASLGGTFWTLDAAPYNRALIASLESGTLQASHLRELQEAFQVFEATPLLKNQLLADRVQDIHDTRALADVRLAAFSTAPGLRGMLAGAPEWLSLRLQLQLGIFDQAGCLALDEFAAQLAEVERIGTPGLLRQADVRHAEILSSSKRVLELYFGPQSPLKNGVLLPCTHLRLGILAIAAARHRFDRAGSFPTSPSDLVPRYLTELPVDPFSGGAPVFEPRNPGLAIGFDRSRLSGADSLPQTEPGGSAARLILRR